MATETRTVHLKLDPAFNAYLTWLGREGLAFSLPGFDVFAAGYRARDDEDAAGPQPAPTTGGE